MRTWWLSRMIAVRRELVGLWAEIMPGVTTAPNNVFLEVALFDPIKIAEAGRRLGIMSDARYRFERGIDHHSVEWGL